MVGPLPKIHGAVQIWSGHCTDLDMSDLTKSAVHIWLGPFFMCIWLGHLKGFMFFKHTSLPFTFGWVHFLFSGKTIQDLSKSAHLVSCVRHIQNMLSPWNRKKLKT